MICEFIVYYFIYHKKYVLYELLSKFNINFNTIERVTYLVLYHEFGGNPDTNIIRDADSISCFDVNLPYYFQRHSEEETVFRIEWGYINYQIKVLNIEYVIHKYNDFKVKEEAN